MKSDSLTDKPKKNIKDREITVNKRTKRNTHTHKKDRDQIKSNN